MKNNCDATECYLCVCMPMNPRDGGAWWAAVYGVAQSRTQLKRLSSSSSSIPYNKARKVEKRGVGTRRGSGVAGKVLGTEMGGG